MDSKVTTQALERIEKAQKAFSNRRDINTEVNRQSSQISFFQEYKNLAHSVLQNLEKFEKFVGPDEFRVKPEERSVTVILPTTNIFEISFSTSLDLPTNKTQISIKRNSEILETFKPWIENKEYIWKNPSKICFTTDEVAEKFFLEVTDDLEHYFISGSDSNLQKPNPLSSFFDAPRDVSEEEESNP